MRRDIGSSPGARVVARPAGLSRSEKCLRRRTSKPQYSSSLTRSCSLKSIRWRGMSRPFQASPNSRNCQHAALGTCTISRPSGFSSRCAASR